MRQYAKKLFLLCAAALVSGVVAWGIFKQYTVLWDRDFPKKEDTMSQPEGPVLPADITGMMKKGEVHNAVLFNNFGGRLMDPETKTMKGDLAALGTPENPRDVMIISEGSVPDEMVELYTAITRLPNSAEVVRILYTQSADRKKAQLLGYTVERPSGTDVAFVRYDGSTPWLEWITRSFPAIDAKAESGALPPKTR